MRIVGRSLSVAAAALIVGAVLIAVATQLLPAAARRLRDGTPTRGNGDRA